MSAAKSLTSAVDEAAGVALCLPVDDSLGGVACRVQCQHGDVHVVPHLREVDLDAFLPELFAFCPEHAYRSTRGQNCM